MKDWNTVSHSDVISSVAMAGRVERYHTWPTICHQTVGAHSWRVALIYIQLFGTPRAEVLEYILKHDLGELGAGDVPFYAKRRVPDLKEATNVAEAFGLQDIKQELPILNKEEWLRFKISDLLEMYENGQIELRMGNQYGDIVSRNIVVALKGMISVADLTVYLNKLWPGKVT